MTEYEVVSNFVLDHWLHFGYFPREVKFTLVTGSGKRNTKIYSWSQYWIILHKKDTFIDDPQSDEEKEYFHKYVVCDWED